MSASTSRVTGADRSGGLGVVLEGAMSPRAMAARSRAALDTALRAPAELWVSVASGEAVLAGAFQRASRLEVAPGTLVVRRGSGGPEVQVGAGTLHVALCLESPAALLPCDEARIVNRHVRPLLRALTRAGGTGAPAHFFGRDWISIAHHPVAWVGFAHDTGTRRTLFEALVAVRAPFALDGRASFLGKTPATLESLAGAPVDEARLAQAVVDAYARDFEAVPLEPTSIAEADDDAVNPDEPPWTAVVDEAIGPLGAGLDAGGVLRVGGDLMVSRDALARLEARAADAPLADLGRIVDEILGAPGVALDGVRSLHSVRDVIAAARAKVRPSPA